MFENYIIKGYYKHKDEETGRTVIDTYTSKGVVKDCCEKIGMVMRQNPDMLKC